MKQLEAELEQTKVRLVNSSSVSNSASERSMSRTSRSLHIDNDVLKTSSISLSTTTGNTQNNNNETAKTLGN